MERELELERYVFVVQAAEKENVTTEKQETQTMTALKGENFK